LLNDLLLLGLSRLYLDSFHLSAKIIRLTVVSLQAEALCPACGQRSQRVHSRYRRQVADVPCAGIPVQWTLTAKRFFCDNPDCPKTTFVERLPQVVAVWSRRTRRLIATQQSIGVAVGGEPGARLSRRLGMTTSPDTLLRLIHGLPQIPAKPVRVLGVDDWAWRRGQRYGTLLVDLEQSEPVDLLPDRTADMLAEWLKAHPTVEIISRDRAGAYADGARRGAPDALQVADRWHLLHNLVEALERLFDRLPTSVRTPPAPTVIAPTISLVTGKADSRPKMGLDTPSVDEQPATIRPPTRPEQIQQARRTRRLERFETVRRLHAQGLSHRTIAQQLQIGKGTLRRYLNATTFPEIARRRKAPSILDPFVPYLAERWQAGCHNGVQLWREIRGQGYAGSRPLVSMWVAQQRRLLPSRPQQAPRGQWPHPLAPPPPARPISARRAAFLLLKPPEQLDQDQSDMVARLERASPQVATASRLTHEFAQMVRERQRDHLDDWLQVAHTCGIRELRYFARGLQRDYEAVAAGLSLPWSAGPTEGHINRLKTLKRQMYGKAGFNLLRQRVLNRV
jgi:transposase